jgi:osmotically-inducible protein OsmY
MFRTLLRLMILLVVLAAVAMFFLGYRLGDGGIIRSGPSPVGTSGRVPSVDSTKVRETGAAIGARIAEGASEAQTALNNGTLTAKIKSKMALDDTLDSSHINVDTANGVVTLSGTVPTERERQRAVQLARETKGVTSVADRLSVR